MQKKEKGEKFFITHYQDVNITINKKTLMKDVSLSWYLHKALNCTIFFARILKCYRRFLPTDVTSRSKYRYAKDESKRVLLIVMARTERR